jgi:phage terminase small subunit
MAGNGNSGRKRKPLAKHVADGTYRADRHGDRGAAPKFGGVPEKPKRLKGEAGKLWDLVVEQLGPHGVLSPLDAPQLTILCDYWARYLRLAPKHTADPTDKDVRLAIHAAQAIVTAIGARFGLTPTDRERLTIEAQEKQGVSARKR